MKTRGFDHTKRHATFANSSESNPAVLLANKNAGEAIPRRSPLSPAARERQRILLHICQALARHQGRGQSVRRHCRRLARRWNGRAFRCDPARHWHLSAERLRKIYYCWRRIGAAALVQNNHGQGRERFTLTAAQLDCIVTTALDRSALSLRQIVAGVFSPQGNSSFPHDRIFRAIPARLREQARDIFKTRRALRQMERAFARRWEIAK